MSHSHDQRGHSHGHVAPSGLSATERDSLALFHTYDGAGGSGSGGDSVPPRVVVVGSTTPLKMQAVVQAFSGPGQPRTEFYGVAVSSGVPSQPFGREETETGARNRAMRALRAVPAKYKPSGGSLPPGVAGVATAELPAERPSRELIGIGIENGIVDGLESLAVCGVVGRATASEVRGAEVFCVCEGVPPIEPAVLAEAIAAGGAVTVGEIYERVHGWPKQSWHESASGGRTTREKGIVEALQELKRQLEL